MERVPGKRRRAYKAVCVKVVALTGTVRVSVQVDVPISNELTLRTSRLQYDEPTSCGLTALVLYTPSLPVELTLTGTVQYHCTDTTVWALPIGLRT